VAAGPEVVEDPDESFVELVGCELEVGLGKSGESGESGSSPFTERFSPACAPAPLRGRVVIAGPLVEVVDEASLVVVVVNDAGRGGAERDELAPLVTARANEPESICVGAAVGAVDASVVGSSGPKVVGLSGSSLPALLALSGPGVVPTEEPLLGSPYSSSCRRAGFG
jgi:hypothetical protein